MSKRSGRSASGHRSTTKVARASDRQRGGTTASGGVFGRLLGPPVPPGMSEMPRFRTSLAQGFLLVAANPALIAACFLFVLAVWLVLLGFGYVGSPLALTQVFALPPLSTALDTQNAVSVAGQRAGLMAGLGLLVVRALVVAILAGAIVEGFEHAGRIRPAAIARGLRASPRVLAATVLAFVALFLAQLGAVFGAGIATLVQVVLPAFALYLLGFVPFAAVRRRDPLPETIRRSIAGARTPGGRHLSFCLLYVLIAFLLPVFLPQGAFITASPSVVTWIGILVMTLIHLGFTAALGYRWLAVEASVAEPPGRV